MKKFLKNVTHGLKRFWSSFVHYAVPGKQAVKGAALGIFIGFALIIIFSSLVMLKYIGPLPVIVMIFALLTVSFLSAWLGLLLLRLINRIPFWLSVALVAAIPGTMMFLHLNGPGTLMIFTHTALALALIGGASMIILKRWRKRDKRSKGIIAGSLVVGLSMLIFSVVWLLQPGSEQPLPANAAMSVDQLPAHLTIANPSEKGAFPVLSLTYGSGLDRHRAEFGEEADIISESVDGSVFLSTWTGFSGKMRTRYFGFDNSQLPLNARVWYPDAQGPFPLVLVVHGNHLAQDFSDPGYEYLGRLLASRGFILASVDENFLNGSYTNFFNGLSNENDARGWLLLKHLEMWRKWNSDQDHLFYEKADLDNIALIGHSRGGEAVAHAALFNKLPFYPDDANEVFDFNFNIGSIVAIAPVDGQYQPTNRRTVLEDVSYLVLQGSHDADLSSYQGMRQFNRIQFSDSYDGFKAGVYIWAANHGQFNSVWGNKDYMSPRINFFNLGQLLSSRAQQTISKTYISAFLETTLKGRNEYRPFFMDHRVGRDWLPETVYITQYEQAGSVYVSTFEEDFDLSTGTIAGSIIAATDLSIWREQKLFLNWGDYNTQVVVLGWNSKDNDTLNPAWCIRWPEGAINTGQEPVLVFALTEVDKHADPPKTSGLNNNNQDKTEEEPSDEKEADKSDDEEDGEDDPGFIDFTIRITDTAGRSVEFPLSSFSPLQATLERQFTKLSFMQTAGKSENILQYYFFTLADLAVPGSGVDFESIVEIAFLFNLTETGVVAVINIGFLKK